MVNAKEKKTTTVEAHGENAQLRAGVAPVPQVLSRLDARGAQVLDLNAREDEVLLQTIGAREPVERALDVALPHDERGVDVRLGRAKCSCCR